MKAIAETRTAPAIPSWGVSPLLWVRSHLRLVLGGLSVMLLLAASTLGRPWLEALGVGSAVIGLLPCAAMCAAGLCMGRGGCAKRDSTDNTGQPGAATTSHRLPKR